MHIKLHSMIRYSIMRYMEISLHVPGADMSVGKTNIRDRWDLIRLMPMDDAAAVIKNKLISLCLRQLQNSWNGIYFSLAEKTDDGTSCLPSFSHYEGQ